MLYVSQSIKNLKVFITERMNWLDRDFSVTFTKCILFIQG